MVDRVLVYVRQFDRNLWILSLGWFVSALGFAVSLPFIAIYFRDEFGISLTGIGVFFAVLAIVRSAVQVVAGEISDRLSRRQMAIYSQMARALAFLGLAAAIYWHWGVWWCGFWLTVHSIFGSIFHPVANALVSDILPKRQRLDGYAITRTAGNLGWAVGPAIGGYVASDSYGTLFVISAAVMLLSSLVFLGMRDVKQDSIQADRFRLRDLAAVKDDSRLAAHSLLTFTLYLVVAQLIVPFSVYAVDLVGITKQQLGDLYT
ncbi:MAG: MFS transporter, partial [Candidatus Zixiibacteriota bacterium]